MLNSILSHLGITENSGTELYRALIISDEERVSEILGSLRAPHFQDITNNGEAVDVFLTAFSTGNHRIFDLIMDRYANDISVPEANIWAPIINEHNINLFIHFLNRYLHLLDRIGLNKLLQELIVIGNIQIIGSLIEKKQFLFSVGSVFHKTEISRFNEIFNYIETHHNAFRDPFSQYIYFGLKHLIGIHQEREFFDIFSKHASVLSANERTGVLFEFILKANESSVIDLFHSFLPQDEINRILPDILSYVLRKVCDVKFKTRIDFLATIPVVHQAICELNKQYDSLVASYEANDEGVFEAALQEIKVIFFKFNDRLTSLLKRSIADNNYKMFHLLKDFHYLVTSERGCISQTFSNNYVIYLSEINELPEFAPQAVTRMIDDLKKNKDRLVSYQQAEGSFKEVATAKVKHSHELAHSVIKVHIPSKNDVIIFGSEKNGLLGQGKYGKAKLAQDLGSGAICVQKISESRVRDTRAYDTYNNESRILASLNSLIGYQSILSQNSGNIKRHLFMKYIPGCTIADFSSILREYRVKLTEQECQRIFCSALEQILKLVNISVIHNDIHQDNVIINPRSLKVKLIDFGLSYSSVEMSPKDIFSDNYSRLKFCLNRELRSYYLQRLFEDFDTKVLSCADIVGYLKETISSTKSKIEELEQAGTDRTPLSILSHRFSEIERNIKLYNGKSVSTSVSACSSSGASSSMPCRIGSSGRK